jgi:hypothetical protein
MIRVRHKNDENKHLWADFDKTLAQINDARAGDHGPHLIDAAGESDLVKTTPTIKIEI